MDEFSREGYFKLLEQFQSNGYTITDYEHVDPDQPHLILRHDIDMSITVACDFAEKEASWGAKATYFVLVRTAMYNPLADGNLRRLIQMQKLGHTIGLHLDAAQYPEDVDVLARAIDTEAGILEQGLGFKIDVVSFHRPKPWLRSIEGPLAGRAIAYGPKYFEDVGYCSDSRGEWHYGHPLEHPNVVKKKALQLVTHPVWWIGEHADTPVDRLEQLLVDTHADLRQQVGEHCQPFGEYLKNPPQG